MDRIWLGRQEAGREVVIADSGEGARPAHSIHVHLTRTAGDHASALGPGASTAGSPGRGPTGSRRRALPRDHHRGDEPLGSIWATRPRAEGIPDREETRLLSLAADQVGLAFRRERLIETANAAEIARQGEALKDALLDSVSHGFRTPLATIRAAAGSLLDPEVSWSDDERRAAARTIDDEAERLNRLVRNLLDMSRIEAGELRPSLEALDAEGLIAPVVERVTRSLGRPPVQIAFGADLPPIRADAEPVRRDARQPAGECRALRPRRRDPRERERLPGWPGPDPGRGRRPGRPGGIAAAPVRQVLPGAAARAKARGAGSGSDSASSRASPRRWEARWPRAPSSLGGLAVDVFLNAAPEPPSETRRGRRRA